jgi:hypothetical protein
MTWKDKLVSALNTLPFTIYGKILVLFTIIEIGIAIFTPKLNLTTISHIAIVINAVLLIIIYCNLRDKTIYLMRFFGGFNKELQIWARVFSAQLSLSIALFILSYGFLIEFTSEIIKKNIFLISSVYFIIITFYLIVLAAGFIFKLIEKQNDYLTGLLLIISINFFSGSFSSDSILIKIIVVILFIIINIFLFIYSLKSYFKQELVKSFIISVYGFFIASIISYIFNILDLTGVDLKNNHFFFITILILYSSMILGLDYRLNYLTSSQVQTPPKSEAQMQ